MIETYHFQDTDFQQESSRELTLLSIISQSYFQPFSLEDNLLLILTALTSGSGVGFNRAMYFRRDGNRLRGELWLGPGSPEEARSVWEVLSTPGIGYVEIVEHNRALLNANEDTLTRRIRKLSFTAVGGPCPLPAAAACHKEIYLVRNATHEPQVDTRFLETIGVDEFLCLPLLARDEVLGVFVLDNAFTQKPIEPRDIKLAALCSLLAANYIHTANLYRRLIDSEKTAAMSEVAMFITHQIRNPLVTIGGFTDQLLTEGCDGEKQRRNLKIIRDEVRRLEEIVYQVGYFLKVSLKEPVYADVQPALEAAVREGEAAARAKGVLFQAGLETGPPLVFCDPATLGEVARNLIDNALEATPAGGKVTLHAHRAKDSRWFQLSVRDTGRGISAADREKLFQPFFTTKEKGMGLGLAFIKRVMDTCGGQVKVRSREGTGAHFLLSFPCQEERRPS
ncbi:MAG: GAF domain-containing sensor histidine kinase [Candidatus Aminicenantes bacterium]|nr:GAF domain-containing sensor histidine kinase [Candidatus Aminicenantes bacterium]